MPKFKFTQLTPGYQSQDEFYRRQFDGKETMVSLSQSSRGWTFQVWTMHEGRYQKRVYKIMNTPSYNEIIADLELVREQDRDRVRELFTDWWNKNMVAV